jgi:hypothetical protein
MADVITFGNGVEMFGPAALPRAIFRHVRLLAADDPGLMSLVAQEELFDAQGGWFFDSLSLSSLRRLQDVINRINTDLPNAISDWTEQYRPRFYEVFDEFKRKLAERIEQLTSGGTKEDTGGANGDALTS